jgi:hypothetical protein
MGKKYLQIIALSAVMGSFCQSDAVGESVCSAYKGYEKTDKIDCMKKESCYWEGGNRPCRSIPENCANFSPQACTLEAYQKYCFLNKEKKCETLKANKPEVSKPVENKPAINETVDKKKVNELKGSSASKKKNSPLQNNSTSKKESLPLKSDSTSKKESLPLKSDSTSKKENLPLKSDSTSKKENSPLKNDSTSKKESLPLKSDSTSKKAVLAEPLCTKKWFKATCKSEAKNKGIDCVWLKTSSTTNAGQKSGCHSKAEFYDKNTDYFDIESF